MKIAVSNAIESRYKWNPDKSIVPALNPTELTTTDDTIKLKFEGHSAESKTGKRFLSS